MPIRSIRATRRISLGIVQRFKKMSMVWWYKTTQKITGTRMANFNSKLLLRQNHQKSQWQLAWFFGVFSNTCGHISQLPGSDFTSLFFIRSCVSSLLRNYRLLQGCGNCGNLVPSQVLFWFGEHGHVVIRGGQPESCCIVCKASSERKYAINSNDRIVGLLPLLWCTHTKWKAVNFIPQNVGAH